MCLGARATVARVFDDDSVPMAELDDGAAVCLLFRPDVAAGDQVLVHCGYVIELLAAHP